MRIIHYVDSWYPIVMKKQINVFIIAPNDVNQERVIAKEVCQKLNMSAGIDTEVKAILWEDHWI